MTELGGTGNESVAREPIRLEAAEGYRKLIDSLAANRRLAPAAQTLKQIFPHLAEYVNGPDLIGGDSYRREFIQGLRDGDEEVIAVLAWSMWQHNNTQKSHIRRALRNRNNVRNNSGGESLGSLKGRHQGLTAENKRLEMVAHLMENQMRAGGLESRAHSVVGGGLKLEDFFKSEGPEEQGLSAIARSLKGVNLDPTRPRDS